MSDRRNNTFRETIRRERRPSNTKQHSERMQFGGFVVARQLLHSLRDGGDDEEGVTVSTLWMKKGGKMEQDRERGGEDGNGGVRVPVQFEGGLQDGVDRHEEETEGRRDDVGIIDPIRFYCSEWNQKRPRGNTEKEKPQ